MNDKFLKPYDPGQTEERIYKLWEESGYFNPDNLPHDHESSFTMVLPPPNVTGVLHLGHAYEDALQDTIIRFARQHGKRALWVPGTDSAAIATQTRVEKDIEKREGKSRHDLGREELVRRVSQYARASESTILNQTRRMGASLDWSRYAYALDDSRSLAVSTAFKQMFDAGLIYKGHRIVNWDPKGQTTISDDEIQYEERQTKFYYLKYGPFTIGTARPETKFGDKYVVMHPSDKRYAEYKHGQAIDLEWINGPITTTVIKDEVIDMEFGTGVMTITPWHDQTDFDIALRHNLDKEPIIDKYGKLLPVAGEFSGMKITEAREKIVDKLQSKGLVEKIDEDYTHNIATAERTGGIIEPQIMEQWFVAVDKPFVLKHSEIPGIESGSELTLKNLMRTAVEHGGVSIPQENFRKIYFHWIDNLHDWCISRQIWFGHRIPIWYRSTDKNSKQEIYCDIEAPQGSGWVQDDDVLDTWFSSALWTFSTLGWPEDKDDLKKFHPTALIAPGYEILNLWVSRMILMSGFLLGQVPFREVLLHGIVRDKQGRKFSKSLGNGIDPIEIIDKYGADALRMGLLVGNAVGSDLKFDESKIRGYRNFSNKLWNIARFVLSQNEGKADKFESRRSPAMPGKARELAVLPKLKNEFHELVRDVTNDMKNYRLHLASEKIYHYIWHRLADEILEDSKRDPTLLPTTYYLLQNCLKLLHPFMPFITEEIWSELPSTKKQETRSLLMVEPWFTPSIVEGPINE